MPQDYVKAVLWYIKAAEQGHANAQCDLGILYAKGENVSRDIEKAAEWLRQAAEQGHVAAQFNLGVLYAHDEGALKDYAQAAEWFQTRQGKTGDGSLSYCTKVQEINQKHQFKLRLSSKVGRDFNKMIYCISDIHGCYDEFMALLEKINFNPENDTVYILGDVIGRGDKSIDCLKYIMKTKKMPLILGNHEQMMLDYGNSLIEEQLRRSDPAGLEEIFSYLRSRPYYKTISVSGKHYFLSHSGLDVSKPFKNQSQVALIWSREEFYDNKGLEKYICIFGHTPTPHLRDSSECSVWFDEFYKDKVCIDCGCAFGGALSALRLDDGEVFYVESKRKENPETYSLTETKSFSNFLQNHNLNEQSCKTYYNREDFVMGKKIYVSYSGKNVKQVETIVAEIEKNKDAACWYANRDLDCHWVRIVDIIAECKLFLLILSEDFLERPRNIIYELNIHLNNSDAEMVIFTLDDIRSGHNLPGAFDYYTSKYSFIEGHSDFDSGINILKEKIYNLLGINAQDSVENSPQEETFVMGEKIYVSYSGKNVEQVETIVAEIEKNKDAKCFYLGRDLEAGEFAERIHKEITECKLFLLILSEDVLIRPRNIINELNIHLNNSVAEMVIFTINDIVPGRNLPGAFDYYTSKYSFIEGHSDFDSGINTLKEKIYNLLGINAQDSVRKLSSGRDFCYGRKIYVSHSIKNLEQVEKIVAEIEKHKDAACWYANRDLDCHWVRIVDFIAECKLFLLILSEDVLERPRNIINELNIHLNNSDAEMVIFTLDDIRSGHNLPGEFDYYTGRYPFIDGHSDFDSGINTLKAKIDELLV